MSNRVFLLGLAFLALGATVVVLLVPVLLGIVSLIAGFLAIGCFVFWLISRR